MASQKGRIIIADEYPRMCSSRPSNSQVSSTPGISSMPHHVASGVRPAVPKLCRGR